MCALVAVSTTHVKYYVEYCPQSESYILLLDERWTQRRNDSRMPTIYHSEYISGLSFQRKNTKVWRKEERERERNMETSRESRLSNFLVSIHNKHYKINKWRYENEYALSAPLCVVLCCVFIFLVNLYNFYLFSWLRSVLHTEDWIHTFLDCDNMVLCAATHAYTLRIRMC